jgi:hypothetical protein
MQILLDAATLPETADHIGDALAVANAAARARGRLLVEVRVDGQTLTDAELVDDDALGRPAEHIECTTADAAALVTDALSGALDALGTAESMQREAAAKLQADQPRAAMETLQVALTLWSQVHHAVHCTEEVLQADLRRMQFADHTAEEHIEALTTRLQALRSALVSQDVVALSDALLYDWPDLTIQWRQFLSELRDLVARLQSPPAAAA